MNSSTKQICKICGLEGVEQTDLGGYYGFSCKRCGLWCIVQHNKDGFADTLSVQLGGDERRALHRKGRLSHQVRISQQDGRYFAISPYMLTQMGLDEPLPTPAQQLDNLIMWAGDNQSNPYEGASSDVHELSAWVGCSVDKFASNRNLIWLIQQDITKMYFRTTGQLNLDSQFVISLTMDGWERYKVIRENWASSNFAFMAMQFGDEQLDRVFESFFSPAVNDTGFELRRLIDRQGAGIIDDQMRVALRTCRFVMADLTHSNRGAYWEAGFGEGLGKPVIYTCRKDIWEGKDTPHFDTNHLVTIIWDPHDLATAASQLKATIRATLPAEAKMEDS